MKIELTIKKEFEVKYLQSECGVRYWEDTNVNGISDIEGELIPCRSGGNWCPLIDIEKGKILNWKEGIEADIHYKVCDNGTYRLLDENQNLIKEIEDYVPIIMSPKENGYGDYVIMEVDKDGFIQDWECDFEDFYQDFE